MGDRLSNIQKALNKLKDFGIEITGVSSVYETESWGGVKQADFLNICIEAVTLFSPEKLLYIIKKIEKLLGRSLSRQRWGPRIIDIDIIFYGKITFESKELKIPHVSRTERKFVLMPLAEIAPDFIDPETGLTVNEMYRNLKSGLRCERTGKIDV